MKKAKPQEVVKTSIDFNDGKKHILQKLFESGEAPELKSIGYARLSDTNTYVSYVLTSKGTEITNIEVEEPNLLGIAEETAKIAFVNSFMRGDL